MILKQYYLGCLSHASYLIADERTKTGVVVDPQRDVDQYLEDARGLGLAIRHVMLTHLHADFLAGHLELRERAGARIHLGARARAEFEFEPMRDGAQLVLGDVRLSFLETPGHTPESVCILVHDLAQDPLAPQAVLTGDTLFVGDVGRPDLMASVGFTSEDLAGLLYDSLHAKILPLPDATLVYPAHGAGSMCGKNLSKETVCALGLQKRVNYALQPMSRDAFIRLVTVDQAEAPAYFGYDAELNRRERPTLDVALERSSKSLTIEEVLALASSGAQVVDTRPADDFAAAHLRGSIQIGLQGSYATWCGTLLDRELPIVLVTEPGRERESVLRLGRIGFDHVVGYLHGGLSAVRARPELVRRARRHSPQSLAAALVAPTPARVLDVRTNVEWTVGHIDGAVHLPLNRLQRELERVPRGAELVVVCAGGYRSSIAASLLRRAGFDEVTDLAGGMGAWNRCGARVTAPG
jgi:glyoxylase-like metal-dependent hydrolase (beta-lactamase superfamily II)/rhodanese-related sulfurtransferase